MSKQLTGDFVVEMMKTSLRNKNFLQVAVAHIKYQFLPDEAHKEVWKAIVVYFDTLGELPTMGILTQQFSSNIKALEVLSSIKNAKTPKKESLLSQLERFIKSSLFLQAYDKIADLYNEDKKDLAFEQMQDFANKINQFSINESYYDKIFADHNTRNISRRVNRENSIGDRVKVATGIDELDAIFHGGIDAGDTFLALAQSGVGKTKLLRYIGVSAARRGHKVLHIQAEGSRQEALDGYDATWSGVRLTDVEYGNFDDETRQKMNKAARDIVGMGGEIYVEAFEQFDTATLQDVRNKIIDIERIHGKIHAVILDYFELFDPGNNRRYKVSEERQRREAVANGLKNIAIEFKVAIFTATQASTVNPSLLNDPDFCQTRYDISEFKGVIKPFSYFITLNQTKDEYKNKFMRIYVDKLRKFKGGQVVRIYQRYDRDRFYDGQKTRAELYQPEAT